jgi:preprotein translocase subunit SecA
MLIEAGCCKNDESLYAATNLGLLHHVHSGLRAHVLFQRDVEYIVQEGQVVLIDEHTGRTMPGAVYLKVCIRRSRPKKV